MNALSIVHGVVASHLRQGDRCIDATCGRGYDTAFLCKCVGPQGEVIAFDIQQEAVDSTLSLLDSKGLNARVICDSHANLDKYVDDESIDCIMFNLGYLPKGNHNIYTHFESTKEAIEKGLNVLKSGGLMCVCVYYGGDSGYEEKDQLLPYLKSLDDSKYQVLATFFYNWKKEPPIPIFIIKN